MRLACVGFLLTSAALFAGTPVDSKPECCELNLWTGQGVSIGNWFLPEINYQVAGGSATMDPARLAVGHHDPDRHGFTQQEFEVAATIRLGEHVSLRGSYSGKVDRNDHWLSEFEEYYAVFDLPADIRIRGGRFAPRIGYQNELHTHDFTFIDQYLASARMFGEDPLVIYGGEVRLPVLRNLPKGWDDRLNVSFGAVPDPEEEGEEHEGPESAFEAEGALPADWSASADYTLGFDATDHTRYEFGVSGVWGGNEFGRHSQVYGAHLQYLWKAAELNPEGHEHHDHTDSQEFFQWRTEVLIRHFGGVSTVEEEEEAEPIVIPGQPAVYENVQEIVGLRAEQGGFFPNYRTRRVEVQAATPPRTVAAETEPAPKPVRDEFMDFGFYTTLTYGFPSGHFQANLRGEYVSGVSEAGLPERWRVSPAITWIPSERLPILFKVQYNYDHAPSFGDEHSIWAQFSLTWGDCCRRR